MSLPANPPEVPGQQDLDELFTVFEGSSPEDVSHARRLWSSMSLLPPLESRLVSADIHQRLPVSRPQAHRRSSTAGGLRPPPPPPPPAGHPALREEERRRYAAMADQRKEILALLGRQREKRIQKELLSVAAKQKSKVSGEKVERLRDAGDTQEEIELVRQLQ